MTSKRSHPPLPPHSVTIPDSLPDPPEPSAAEGLFYATVAQDIMTGEFVDWSQETETVRKPDSITLSGTGSEPAEKAAHTVV
jgi:hypothetical protein